MSWPFKLMADADTAPVTASVRPPSSLRWMLTFNSARLLLRTMPYSRAISGES